MLNKKKNMSYNAGCNIVEHTMNEDGRISQPSMHVLQNALFMNRNKLNSH